ncbi:RCC1 domain-containing protein 1 [Sergentomyia squamirostris]
MEKLSNVLFVGHNGFQQFRVITKFPSFDFAEINIEPHSEDFHGKSLKIAATLTFSVMAAGRKLLLRGFFTEEEKIYHEFADEILDISCSTKHCLILLKSGKLYKYCADKNEFILLNFLTADDNSLGSDHFITHIACGETKNIAVTNQNIIYDIPTKIHKFSKHIKIQKISSGHEHVVLLTRNGDVYTWGNGLRGQLGHGDLENHTEPQFVEALGGIKIVDISAGGWHSAAISAFGDLYTWGWNVNGQLGISVSNPSIPASEFTPVVYCTPEIIDLPQNGDVDDLNSQLKVFSVTCGNQHTFIQSECGKILSTGLNKFGQLGRPSSEKKNFDDKFSIVKENSSNCSITCGTYCTLLIVSQLNN